MAINRITLNFYKQIRLCSTAVETATIKPKAGRKSTKLRRIEDFLSRYPHNKETVSNIPQEYLFILRKTNENLYLIDGNVAKKVASYILPGIIKNKEQIVCENSPGLGLIVRELLEKKVKMVRLYETNNRFVNQLKKLDQTYPDRVEIFNNDVLQLSKLYSIDKLDHGTRVEEMLRAVPRKSWSDDPVMTIIGTASSNRFLNFLMTSLILQNNVVSRGRFQLYLFIQPESYRVLTAGPDSNNSRLYNRWTVLFNLLCDLKLLDTFPREVFVPWSRKDGRLKEKPEEIMHFVRINFKRHIPVAPEHLSALFFFLKEFFGVRRKRVIPSLEEWVPGSGFYAIVPQFAHDDFYKNMNIFTEFMELTPRQMLHVFHEMIAHPDYETSPFMAMVENHLTKDETIDSELDDYLEKNENQLEDEKSEEKSDIT